MKIVVVGCGLSGIVASHLLARKGHQVEVFETRPHHGGNCYDETIRGVNVHTYGAHIFHTNDREVWDFVNQFAAFANYTHRVRANTREGLISIPYSRKTERQLGRSLSDDEIVDLIFRQYSERQWGVPWSELPASIHNRVPQRRDDDDDRYFTDAYQGVPAKGYARMLSNMLEGIDVRLGVEPDSWKRARADKVVYTGKLDAYFDFQWGRLPYRSLRFEHRVAPATDRFSFEKGAVVNECNDKTFNRTVDHSAFAPGRPETTVLTRDYPVAHDASNEPMYPINFGRGERLYRERYRKAAAAQTNTLFLGRLATYKYLDMWMAIKQAMRLAERF